MYCHSTGVLVNLELKRITTSFSLKCCYSFLEIIMGGGKRPVFIGIPPGSNWKGMTVGSSNWHVAGNKLKASD